MLVPTDRPVTADVLASFIDSLVMPPPMKVAIFGLTLNGVGRLRADGCVSGLAHLVTPSQALLARFMATEPDLALPLKFPTVSAFLKGLQDALPQPTELRTVALILGREQSAASRWKRGECQTAYPAVRALMALVSADPSRIERRWTSLCRIADLEARLRGIACLDAAGTWGPKIQAWVPDNTRHKGPGSTTANAWPVMSIN